MYILGALFAAFAIFTTHGGGGSSPVITAQSLYTYSPASTSQAVGTLSATNSPTSWTITGGNSAGNFAIDNSGNITITSTGQANLTGSSDEVDFSLTVTASNGSTSSPATIPIAVYADGFANAPSCTVQNAALLNNYPSGHGARTKGNGNQPQWNVAGVDYCVGLPSGTTLSDPTLGGLPSGCSYASFVVSCATASVTITGWDFSLHNGIGLRLTASGITVTKNNFNMGSNNKPVIELDSGATNTTITQNNITNNGQIDSSSFGGLIYQNAATGPLTIEYNYMHDTGADIVDVTGGTTTIQYNLMMNDGETSGSHPDYLQHSGGSTSTDIIKFNTWVQNSASIVVATQGTTFGDNSVQTVGTNEFSYNTLIASQASSASYNGARVYGPSINGTATISLTNNFGDVSGTSLNGIFYPGSSNTSGSGTGTCSLTQATFSKNINMVSGSAFSNCP